MLDSLASCKRKLSQDKRSNRDSKSATTQVLDHLFQGRDFRTTYCLWGLTSGTPNSSKDKLYPGFKSLDIISLLVLSQYQCDLNCRIHERLRFNHKGFTQLTYYYETRTILNNNRFHQRKPREKLRQMQGKNTCKCHFKFFARPSIHT